MKDKIMAVLEQSVENGDAAGANVLVIHNGKEAVYCGYGMRDMENSLPMERDTIFRLYSQTKPVTAAAAVTLMEQGRLNAGARGCRITSRNMLRCMSAGTECALRRRTT